MTAAAVQGTTSTLLAQRGVTLEVLIDAPGDGGQRAPALVLLPSSLRDSRDFDPLVRPLVAAGFRVLRPQPRGMGASCGPLEGLTLADLAGDVQRVIVHHAGGRAVIVGHAFGHFVARLADLLFPAAVRGVVVLAGAAREFPPGLPQSLEIAADPAAPEALRLQHLQHAFFAPGQDARAWLTGWHPALRDVYRRAALQPPKSTWWPHANAPLLELQGEHDPWRPPHTRDELIAALGPARVQRVLIAGASHAMVPEQPLAVAEALVAWVRQLGA